MTIATSSRAYSNNLRKFRRFLQGRGVNLRETFVEGSVYANTRITVPGLHSDDAIISVLDMDDQSDATGYLNDEGAKASLTVFSTNKAVKFEAIRGGDLGNTINVKAAADPNVSAPLSVVIGDYDTVLGTTGNPGKTIILVNLATNAAGAALTDGSNSAANVLAAVNDYQEQFLRGAALVDVSLPGTGATDWTATGPTTLSGGTDFDQGPAKASLTDSNAFGTQHTGSVRYDARKAGANGNSITLTYTAGGSLAVSVVGTAITVTYVDQTTTAQEVVDKVNATVAASALVVASVAPGASPSDVIDDNQGPTALTGGADPGIELTVASNVTLKVLWLTHDELDEN